MPTCHESAELLEQYGLAYIRTSQHEQLHRPISRAGPIPSRKMKRLWEQHWSMLGPSLGSTRAQRLHQEACRLATNHMRSPEPAAPGLRLDESWLAKYDRDGSLESSRPSARASIGSEVVGDAAHETEASIHSEVVGDAAHETEAEAPEVIGSEGPKAKAGAEAVRQPLPSEPRSGLGTPAGPDPPLNQSVQAEPELGPEPKTAEKCASSKAAKKANVAAKKAKAAEKKAARAMRRAKKQARKEELLAEELADRLAEAAMEKRMEEVMKRKEEQLACAATLHM